jgi:hypothetical protein
VDHFADVNGLKYFEKPDSFFHSALVFRRAEKNDHVATFKTDPRWSNINPVRLEINPNRFASFDEMNAVVKGIIKSPLTISRVDLCVDLSMPLRDVHKSLLIPRKRSRKAHITVDFKNMTEVESYYYGKPPETIVTYEWEAGGPTRIEKRMVRDKVPSRCDIFTA